VLSPTATLTPLTTTTSTGIAALTDLQALQSFFNLFSTEMGTAPTPTTPALLTFFDTTNFRQNGQKLAAFLQQITTNPKLLGGQLGFGAIWRTSGSEQPNSLTSLRQQERLRRSKAAAPP
jgi:hypothetical protein